MSAMLNNEQITRYHEQGYLFPIKVLEEDDAIECHGALEAFEGRRGEVLAGKYRHKVHLLFPWAAQLIRHAKILDMVEDLIGPDILVWSSQIVLKEPDDGRFVSWHQDKAHWGLDADDIVTVWLALSDSIPENGCMRFLPGTHKGEVIRHIDTWEDDNILPRGQTLVAEIDPEKAVDSILKPGEVSLHDGKLWHASGANVADYRRVAVAIRYMPTRTRQSYIERDYATLVRGKDSYGNFELEDLPTREMEPEFVALHDRATAAQQRIYYRDTDIREYDA